MRSGSHILTSAIVLLLVGARVAPAQPYGPPLVLSEPATASSNSFGYAVAMTSDGCLAASPAHLLGSAIAGAVHRFDPTGNPVQVFVNPSPAGAFASFGHSVALVGGNVLVGAPFENANHGAAYLFDGTSGIGLLTIPNPAVNDVYFGWSVAALGGDLLVGAPQSDNGHGLAYRVDGTTGVVQQLFLDPNNGFFDDFGYAVTSLGGNAIVGAPRVDTGAT